jgi:hypothetical protein
MNLKLENLQPIASNNAEICEQWSLFELNQMMNTLKNGPI